MSQEYLYDPKRSRKTRKRSHSRRGSRRRYDPARSRIRDSSGELFPAILGGATLGLVEDAIHYYIPKMTGQQIIKSETGGTIAHAVEAAAGALLSIFGKKSKFLKGFGAGIAATGTAYLANDLASYQAQTPVYDPGRELKKVGMSESGAEIWG